MADERTLRGGSGRGVAGIRIASPFSLSLRRSHSGNLYSCYWVWYQTDYGSKDDEGRCHHSPLLVKEIVLVLTIGAVGVW